MKPLGRWARPLAALFGMGVHLRNWAYDRGVLQSVCPAVPTCVIGNLSAGGTGKTPTVIAIARHFMHRGHRPAIITRGYARRTRGLLEVLPSHSPAEVGDEPLLIKQSVPEVPVVVSADRLAAVQYLIQHHSPEVIFLDDGFQHRALRPHCAVVLMAGHRPYDEDTLLPAGTLREPLSALRRADGLLITKHADSNPAHWRGRLGLPDEFPVWSAPLRYAPLRPLRGEAVGPPECPLFVAALADPSPAEAHLRSCFPNLQIQYYPDHYPYSPADIKTIQHTAQQAGCDAIITTEKDWIKLRHLPLPDFPPWWLLSAEMNVPQEFLHWLEDRLVHPNASRMRDDK